MCKWGRLYGYIYNLISAFAIKNKMNGVVGTPPVVIDDRQSLHCTKQWCGNDKKSTQELLLPCLKVSVSGDTTAALTWFKNSPCANSLGLMLKSPIMTNG